MNQIHRIAASSAMRGGCAMVERSFDATQMNVILNDPTVRPWIADAEGVLDITKQVNNPLNVLLMGKHGGCLFLRVQPGVYEVHVAVLPGGRGPWAADLAHAALWYMFTGTDCAEVLARVPETHAAARAFAKAAGLTFQFTRSLECTFRDEKVDADVYGLGLQDWLLDALGLVVRGDWLFGRMQDELARLGIDAPDQRDDSNHERFAGAALEMARNGQIAKAVAVYNRWACLARRPLIELVQVTPPTVRMGSAFVVIGPTDIRVLLA